MVPRCRASAGGANPVATGGAAAVCPAVCRKMRLEAGNGGHGEGERFHPERAGGGVGAGTGAGDGAPGAGRRACRQVRRQ